MTQIHRPMRLTFPQTQVREPVVYRLGVDYGVVTSIRRASIEDHFGWMVLEMTGEPEQLDAAEAYLTSLGIEVDPVAGTSSKGDRGSGQPRRRKPTRRRVTAGAGPPTQASTSEA